MSEYDASLLTATKIQADWFEQAVKLSSKNSAKAITNWMNGELARLLNSTGTDFMDTKITPQNLVALIDLIDKGTISNKLAKTVFEEMFATGKKPAGIIEAKGLTQVSDSGQIDGIIEKAIEDNPNAIADIKAGKEQALKFLVGQVMKLSRGRANPQMVNKLLIERFK